MAVYKKVPGCETVNISTLEFDTKPTKGSFNPVTSGGVAEAVAEAAQISDEGAKTESDLVDGALSIGEPNSITKLTLTTAQTLTVLANEGVPNFALEIDNTGNSNDVTVTVKDSTGTTTLKTSAAGGNTIDDGAYVQLTCVGNCWTMAVFS